MCDTFVALPDATLDGSVIFGKNSVGIALSDAPGQVHGGNGKVHPAGSPGGICMHGQFETRGSQISLLTAQQNEHWLIVGEVSAKHFRPFPCQQEYQRVALPEMVRHEHHPSHANPSK